jgi:hypothetical protein
MGTMPARHFASALFALALGCSASLPAPPETPQPEAAFQEVPFPPPPARPEQVPEQPEAGTVWIDGEWTFTGRYWAWTYGRWVRSPAPDAGFAPSSCRFAPDGKLFCARGTWYREGGAALEHPPELARAEANEGDVLDEEGHRIDVAPNRPAHRDRSWKNAKRRDRERASSEKR